MTRRALSDEQKAAHWKATDKLARLWETRFGKAVALAFEHDRREILALLSDAKRKSLERKATVDWQDYLLTVTDYLAMGGADNWRSTFLPVIRGIIGARGEQLNADFGMQFDVENVYATEWFESYIATFASPINDVTMKDIARMMEQAQSEGWSIPTAQKHLEQLFEQYINGTTTPEDWEWFQDRMPAYRRELIARDQIQRSSNGGSVQIYKGYGAQRKEWLATKDNRVRDEHLAANGQVVGIDEPFIVGEYEMMFPSDDSMGAPVEMFIQDRCTVLPVIE